MNRSLIVVLFVLLSIPSSAKGQLTFNKPPVQRNYDLKIIKVVPAEGLLEH